MAQTGASMVDYQAQWQSNGGYPQKGLADNDAYAQDAFTASSPMYPIGGYVAQGSASPNPYAQSGQRSSYAQGQQPSTGYTLPSQLLREGADYNRGMPAPSGNAGYGAYQGDGQPRIRLDA